MTTPALGAGDLFIVSAGPGDLPTAQTLVDIARKAGARIALVTAQPAGGLAKHVDVVTVIPAQTMANDQSGGKLSVLPMGSLFETAQMIAFELAILKLRPRFGETSETMRARHTNLE
jgi:6-phospho-3-hexuloisomerase